MSTFYSIRLKDGRTLSYSLTKEADGWKFDGKKIAPLRNWMQAEIRATEKFLEIIGQHKAAGDFYDAYSTDGGVYDVDGVNYTWQNEPEDVTEMHNYGMKPYMLEFQAHENVENKGGKWVYDSTYFTLAWDIRTRDGPTTLRIKKNYYPKGASVHNPTTTYLSDEIMDTDCEGVLKLMEAFMGLHRSEKHRAFMTRQDKELKAAGITLSA